MPNDGAQDEQTERRVREEHWRQGSSDDPTAHHEHERRAKNAVTQAGHGLLLTRSQLLVVDGHELTMLHEYALRHLPRVFSDPPLAVMRIALQFAAAFRSAHEFIALVCLYETTNHGRVMSALRAGEP